MPTQRVFLDWTKPALAQAADWLLAEPSLADHLIVLPGSRAGRRLMELILQRSDGHLVDPPTLTTIGSLSDKLIADLPTIACPTVLRLLLVEALQQLNTDHLELLIPNAPAPAQRLAWLNLASPVEKLFSTLGAGGLIPANVMQHAQQWPDFTQAQRWEAITQLHADYMQLLAEHDLHDINLARITALSENRITFTGKITLIGTVDINPLTCLMLDHVADQCTALIHAPEKLGSHFGAYGQLDTDHWQHQPLDIPSQQRIVVDRPTDQIAALLSDLQSLSQETQLRSDTLTLGVGDEQLGPLVEQLATAAGLHTRWHQQRDILLSRPVSLLLAFNQFCKSDSSTDLALLLRHPDMQQYLHQHLPMADHTLLDQYLGDHLQNQLDPDAPGMEDADHPLLKTAQIISQLAQAHLTHNGTLAQWAQQISALLSELYDTQALTPNTEDDAPVIDPLSKMADVLRDWFNSDDTATFLPNDLTFEQATELLRSELANTPLARPGSKPAVEILGWLELHLDDAPHLYILNFNEGSIPGDVRIDPFLPDSICEQLGLTCDKTRLARDRYMLEAILNSRQHLRLIAGQTNLRNEPMLPSRLMLQCDQTKLAQTVLDYFEPTAYAYPPLLPSGEKSQLSIPVPIPPEQPMQQLSVTAFRAYLQCPYRFYLRYIRKLRKPEAYLPELSPPAFGNLAHEVLQQFGSSDWIDCVDDKALAEYLSRTLDHCCEARYGEHLLPAIQIQREQLRQRLELFARSQTTMRSQGWRIITNKIESQFTVDFPVDNQPFSLIGRIDRMDRHVDTGELRIMDYKTSEASKKPDAVHRIKTPDGGKQWVDLQLPLYRVLAASEIYHDKAQLGFCQLGKQLDKIGFEPAPWETAEINEAITIAQQVIRAIRNGIFWPPNLPPEYDDGLEGICHDAYPLRQQEIRDMITGGVA